VPSAIRAGLSGKSAAGIPDGKKDDSDKKTAATRVGTSKKITPEMSKKMRDAAYQRKTNTVRPGSAGSVTASGKVVSPASDAAKPASASEDEKFAGKVAKNAVEVLKTQTKTAPDPRARIRQGMEFLKNPGGRITVPTTLTGGKTPTSPTKVRSTARKPKTGDDANLFKGK
jgi:hypothetical protein